MAGQDEMGLVERVFLRIGSADTDEQLQTSLGKFLTPVLLKLNSPNEAVRTKVMELLVHINKRLKSRQQVQLPVENLITQFLDPSASFIITNFSLIYIKMGYPRLPESKRGELLPLLLKCLDNRPQAQADSLLNLIVPSLEHVKMPPDAQQRRNMFGLSDKAQTCKVLLDFFMDLLILPYGAQLSSANQSSPQDTGSRPSTAQGSRSPSVELIVPEGMSEYSFKRLTSEGTLTPEKLEQCKIGVLKFLGCDILPEEDVVCHYIIGSADTRHGVVTAADMEIKRIQGGVDWNNANIVSTLYELFQGTVDIKGQPATRADKKKKPACTRIKLKIFPYLLRSKEACNKFPACIQIIFDCLFGQNTHAKLKNYAVQFVHHVCFNCSENNFKPISSVLLSGLVKLIGEAKEDSKLRGLSYVAVGKIVKREPQLVSSDIALVQKFFEAMCQEDTETRLSVQEALSLMAAAFKNLSSSNKLLMEALILQNIEKEEPQARVMAVQYAIAVFPKNHIPSRYVLLLASGDKKEDVQTEADKALGLYKHPEREDGSDTKEDTPMPKFKDMMTYIKEKADLCLKSQHKYTVGNNVLPYNPVVFEKIVTYLRGCLAAEAGIVPDLQSLSTMQAQAPLISKYINQSNESLTASSPLLVYVDFIKSFLTAVGGGACMYCLLELVAMAPSQLAGQFMGHLEWIKKYIFSSKDDLKTYSSELLAIILSHQPNTDKVTEIVTELDGKMTSNKNFEVQQGCILALGYIIGHYRRLHILEKAPDSKLSSAMTSAVLHIGGMLKPTEEIPDPLIPAICHALGEMGRNAPMLLPTGNDGDEKGAITKLSVVNTLLKMLKSGKESNKTKEKAVLCLGNLCVGEKKFPFQRKIIEESMEAAQAKQIELNMTIGDALVVATQGSVSPSGRNLWTETTEDFKACVQSEESDVPWYLDLLMSKYVNNVNPHLRQAACIWLLALVKDCSDHPIIQENILGIQSAFMKLLSESDDMTQDVASKGLGLVYDACSKEQKDSLVSELVETLTTGKRAKQVVTEDSEVFEKGSMGKTPDGAGLSTYKELCSLANDLNQPDLIYKFMHLANHNAIWNSKKGAAFGFSTIAAQAGEQLAPYLQYIVPRLYRYQFDPNPKIQQAMTSIWQAIVKDNASTVEKFMKEICVDLVKNLTDPQWRVRESSCMAVCDLLRGRPLDDIVDQLDELWHNCLRVRDDIKESVRNAADQACKTLSRASIKICDVNYGKVGQRATTIVIPCLLKHSISSQVPEVRAIGLSTLLKISKNAGALLKEHIPLLVPALLEAVSGLEPQVLNYYSLHTASSQAAQDVLDNARIAASKMSPMMETVNYCVQYVDDSVLPELVPRITDLVKSGIGIGTKVSCASFIVSLVHHCPRDLTPHAGKLLGTFLNGLNDRNSSVRKAYADALGYLVKVAKDSSVEKLVVKITTWYVEKQDEGVRKACGQALHAMAIHGADILKRHAAKALPLVFFAMHESVPADENKSKSSEDNQSVWEEVWLEVTPGTEAGIKLYLQEIVSQLCENIESSSWVTKAQAARAMSTVASKLTSDLPPNHLDNILNSLLNGLQGRTWDGKETLLNTLSTLCTSCKKIILESPSREMWISKILEALLRECRKEKIPYKMEAIQALSTILEDMEEDKFKEIWEIVSPVLLKENKGNKEDEDDDQTAGEKEKQWICYITALGQAWPKQHSTQECYSTDLCQLLLNIIPHSTWKSQSAALTSLVKYLERHCMFTKEHIESQKRQELVCLIVQTICPCLGNLKYSIIRTETLNALELIVKLLKDCDKLSELSLCRGELVSCLQIMASNDSNPQLKDSALDLLNQLKSVP